MRLEGIVSKKSGQPYVSGRNVGRIKVNTSVWRAANKNRFDLLDKSRRSRYTVALYRLLDRPHLLPLLF